MFIPNVKLGLPLLESRPKYSECELIEDMKRQAFSDEERFKVLDARDKLMRLRAPPKPGEVRLKGCCQDICPEKERYSRATKNQLRVYEKIYGEVNHKAAIKEVNTYKLS